jgi:hypothetical protein
MIHPKDEGLAFPRKIKEKKVPSPLRSKPKKYQKASISEEMLQNYAEEECTRFALDFNHAPQELYHWLSSPSDYCPEEAKSYLKRYFFGRPDLVIKKRVDGSDYNIVLEMELKTDSPQSKLRGTQKRYLRGKNFLVPRSKEEIQKAIKEFNEFEIEFE